MPEHGHGGLELTLVLQGAFADGDERFQRGDVETEDATDQHVPVAEPGQTCICLAATDAPLRFTSFLPRLVQPFVRI
jgi:putative transcriptional regulator